MVGMTWLEEGRTGETGADGDRDAAGEELSQDQLHTEDGAGDGQVV